MRSITGLILTAWILAMPFIAKAGTVAGTGGATEVTQLANESQLIQMTAQSMQQIAQLGQQLQYAQAQLKNLTASPSEIWGTARQDLTQLTSLISNSQGLAFQAGNLSQKFKQTYPGYSANADYTKQYADWVNNSLGGISSALQSAGFQASHFANEQQALQQIRNISAGSPGALQAIQAGNMIASNQADQLMQLRQLMTAQMNAQDGYLAGQQQDKVSQKQALDQFLKQPPVRTTGFKSYSLIK